MKNSSHPTVICPPSSRTLSPVPTYQLPFIFPSPCPHPHPRVVSPIEDPLSVHNVADRCHFPCFHYCGASRLHMASQSGSTYRCTRVWVAPWPSDAAPPRKPASVPHEICSSEVRSPPPPIVFLSRSDAATHLIRHLDSQSGQRPMVIFTRYAYPNIM